MWQSRASGQGNTMGYRFVLLVKLAAVMTYGGGLVGAFLASSLEERKRAVHGIASPALLVIWLTGYALISMIQVPLTELWIVGALVSSLASQLALVHSVSRDRRSASAFL